jgi:hypothetical protein
VGCPDIQALLHGSKSANYISTVIGFTLSGAFYFITLWHIRILRRQNAASRYLLWLQRAAWLFSGLLLIIVASTHTLADYWGATALVFGGAAALGSGSVLARIRKTGDVSPVRRMVFSLPFVLVALVLTLAAELLGTAVAALADLYRNEQFSLPHSWIWHAPEFIRGPLAMRLARMNGDLEVALYATGMVGTQDLKQAALATTPKHPYVYAVVWNAWAERDPEALQTAPAVQPRPLGTALANSTYDLAAGMVLGARGTAADIKSRLNGEYSAQFVSGIMLGCSPERVKELEPDIVSYFQNQVTDRTCWYVFSQKYPAQSRSLLFSYLQSAPPVNYAQLYASARLWQIQNFEGAVDLALNSSDPNIRKMVLENLWQLQPGLDRTRRLTAIATGSVANSDSNERRAAASILGERQGPNSILGSYKLSYSAAPVPLSAVEKLEIQRICTATQNWLDKYGK